MPARDVVARIEFEIPDPEATEEARAREEKLALVVYQQDPVALTQSRIGRPGQIEDPRLGTVAGPLKRSGKKIAVIVGVRDLQDRNRWQLLGIAVGFSPLLQMTVIFKGAQKPLQLDPVGPLDSECLCDVPLGCLRGIVGDPFEDLVAGWDAYHAAELT